MRRTLEQLNAEQYEELKRALQEILRLCDLQGVNSKEQIKVIVKGLLNKK